jgi:hypothetical protein
MRRLLILAALVAAYELGWRAGARLVREQLPAVLGPTRR